MSDISSLNFIKVEKWKGEGENSCFWNIAANQLGEGATNAEIAELTNQIKALNAEKNSSVIREGDVLYTEDTVLIPLEYAIDEITTNIGTKTTEIFEANTTLTTAQGKLTAANNKVATALSELQSAQSNLDSLGEKDDKEKAQQAVADAQKKYTEALEEQQEALEEQQDAEEKLNAKKEELDDLETELKDIQEEYKDAEDVSQEDLEKLNEEIGKLDEEIQKAEDNLENLKEDAAKETAEAQQKAAENITTTDKDGNITMKEGVTADDIEKANNSGQGTYDKSKLKEVYQGGGITKYYDEFGNEINADLIKDADNIQKHIAGLDSLTDEEAIKRYDIDGDGKVTITDATALQKESSEENETTSENNDKIDINDVSVQENDDGSKTYYDADGNELSEDEIDFGAESETDETEEEPLKEVYDANNNVVGYQDADGNLLSIDEVNANNNTKNDGSDETETETEEQAAMKESIANAYASQLHSAMDYNGTDEEDVKGIIYGLEGQDLVDVVNAYKETFGEDLVAEIKDEFYDSDEKEVRNDLVNYINDAIENPTTSNKEITQEDVYNAWSDAFLEATAYYGVEDGKNGTDEVALQKMVFGLTQEELSAIIEHHNNKYSDDDDIQFEELIKGETSGDLETTLMSAVELAKAGETTTLTPEEYDYVNSIVMQLHAAAEEDGTDNDALRRILIDSKMPDALMYEVIELYNQKYGDTYNESYESLEKMIEEELDDDDNDEEQLETRIFNQMDDARKGDDLGVEITSDMIAENRAEAIWLTTNRSGTDEKVLTEILLLSQDEITLVNKKLQEKHGVTLYEVIDDEIDSDDAKQGMLDILKNHGITK